MSDEDLPGTAMPDPDGVALLQQPATRAELLQLGQLCQLGLMSHTLFGLAIMEGDEELQRQMGERTVDQATQIGKAMRDMLTRWKSQA